MYNVTWGTFVQPLLEWKSNGIFLVGVCRHRCPECNARAPCCYLWPVRRTIFSTLSHKWHDFKKKKVTGHEMRVSSLSTTFFLNIFHSKKNWARYEQKCMLVFMENARYSRPFLVKLEFPGQIIEKYSTIKFHKNTSSGSRVVPCDQGQTWRS